MKIEFFPEIFNMNINEITVVLIIKYISPDMFIELMTGQDFTFIKDQVLKQVKFFLCEVYIAAFANKLA